MSKVTSKHSFVCVSSDRTRLEPNSDRILQMTSVLSTEEVYCYLGNHRHPREEESNVQRTEYCGEFLVINFDLNSGLFMHALAYLAFNLSAVKVKFSYKEVSG